MASAPSLQGSLDSFQLPEVLTFLSTARKSGTLVVESLSWKSSIFFDGGALVYATSNQAALRLGELLVRKKKITAEQFEQIDTMIQHDGGRFGQIAVQQGVLTDDQLRDFLKIQVSEILFDAFLWKGGSFTFADEMALPPYATTISVDLANLIMEGARRIEEWEQCRHLLPDSHAVYRVVSSPEAEKITLSLDEWKILFLINGQRTLDDLCNDSDDALHVYRVVYGLLSNKLIEPVAPPADDYVSGKMPAMMVPDETMKQPPVNFGGESTIRETGSDDTNLLISSEARLSYADVVAPIVAQLTFANGESAGTVIAMTENEYRIGRQRDNEIQLGDLGVSGHHARIYRGPDAYVVEDLKSRNGTWLNGVRVYHSSLSDGDTLRLGETDFKYAVLFGT
jgi:hypothetical protein